MVCKFSNKKLKKYLSENIFSKLSIIFSYFSLKKFKNKLDPRKYNGAIFLGLKGPVVKSHGATDALGFSYSVELCYKIAKGNLNEKIKKNLEHVKDLRKQNNINKKIIKNEIYYNLVFPDSFLKKLLKVFFLK